MILRKSSQIRHENDDVTDANEKANTCTQRVIDVLKQFCETTSIRGLPRIVKSKYMFGKIYWTLAFLLATGAMCHTLYDHIDVYFSYSTVTKTTIVSELEIIKTFPDVTVCNLFGFAHMNETPKTALEYRSIVFDLVTKYRLPVDFFNYFEAYLSFMTEAERYEAGHKIHDFIVDCKKINMISGFNDTCPENMFVLFTDLTYLNCYTIQLQNDAALRYITSGISLTINLNHYNLNVSLLDLIDGMPTERGIAVYIHEHNTMPPYHTPLKISPGHAVEIQIETEDVIKLPPPYGTCMDGSDTKYTVVGSDSKNYSYTMISCVYDCVQTLILERCKCVSREYPLFRGQPICLNGRNNVPRIINETDCLFELLEENIEFQCLSECKEPCRGTSYKYTASQSIWPNEGSQLDIYKKYIQKSKYQHFYEEYEELLTLGKYTLFEKGKKLEQLNTLRNNMVKLDISLTSNSKIVRKEIPLINDISLFTSISGTFIFYIGFTFFSLLEMVEYTWKILKVIFNSKKQRSDREISLKG
ncbi:unnamed protein product [Owenia fusiformis]|uniref:Uncharacterized protein n=1 Tax=Owenia fusiformis TaxID=6347 RepID=A0A8J1T6C2_OWEFU|nr:unnamed protein product [Owenia fusiformis]